MRNERYYRLWDDATLEDGYLYSDKLDDESFTIRNYNNSYMNKVEELYRYTNDDEF